MESKPEQSLYTISTVAELTGIKAITLRAWERRYGLINPNRTETGRRLYSDKDVKKIQLIKEQLDRGVAISRAIDALMSYSVEDMQESDPQTLWQQYFEQFREAISHFDEPALDHLYHEITGLYPIDLVTQNLIVPLLRQLGEEWDSCTGTVAQEHFFSAYLRNKIGARFHHQNRINRGDPIIVAGLPGDHHELGLLLFALALMNNGLRVLILGVNLPLTELQHTLHQVKARAVILAGKREVDVLRLIEKLKTIQHIHKIPVFIGGKVASQYESSILRAGMHPLASDHRTALEQVENVISAIT